MGMRDSSKVTEMMLTMSADDRFNINKTINDESLDPDSYLEQTLLTKALSENNKYNESGEIEINVEANDVLEFDEE